MMYVRYPLPLRQIEELLFERGIDDAMQSSTTSAAASPGYLFGPGQSPLPGTKKCNPLWNPSA
jgi:hypothetical protein